MKLHIIRKLHSILKPYDGICPHNCYLCEVHEDVIFLPNEEKLITTNPNFINKFLKHKNGFYYIDDNTHCPYFVEHIKTECLIYRERPIDCRIFPFYPLFNIEAHTYDLKVSETYCPISNKVLPEMERDVIKVIDVINNNVSVSWKEMYNKLNCTELEIQVPQNRF